MHGGHALLRLHRLHHLLLRLLGDGGQRLLFLWRQGERLQVIAARLGLQVRVVEQEALLLLEFGDLPIDAHRAEPAPGERRRVLEALEDVPGGNLLLGGHLKALTERQRDGTPRRYKPGAPDLRPSSANVAAAAGERFTYLLLEAGDLVALGVDEGALRFTGYDVAGLLGQRQKLADLIQAFRLPVSELFLWRRNTKYFYIFSLFNMFSLFVSAIALFLVRVTIVCSIYDYYYLC